MKEVIHSTDVPAAPFNTYDSILETPGGRRPGQHAWLTLQLRVSLKFVDSTNRTDKLVIRNGQLFAKDYDNFLFPALDWPAHLKERFQKEYARRAEDTWNFQFLLVTPGEYSGFDYRSSGVRFRPNVRCLFRMSVQTDSGQAVDTSPAAGPLRAGPTHRTVEVYNLSLNTKEVRSEDGTKSRNFDEINGLSFRSDAVHYDDSDLFHPAWWQRDHNIISNTVGHEVGHALGQCHIMGLKGIGKYRTGGAHSTEPAAYGVGSKHPADAWNIMGGGDKVDLINAVSWRERIALHTGIPARKWEVTKGDVPARSADDCGRSR